jgi:hypothetical protein
MYGREPIDFASTGTRQVVLGVCAMDIKARSKAMGEILTRIVQLGQVEVKVFGDKVILDEGVLHHSKYHSIRSN